MKANACITNCLTISLNHITDRTICDLKNEPNTDKLGISVYPMCNYGFWIFCPDNMIERLDGGHNIPNDLWDCMLLAYEKNCKWLCLDCDGAEVDELMPVLNK